MPQLRIHATNADRQRAYRARLRARLQRAAVVAANPHQVRAPFCIIGGGGIGRPRPAARDNPCRVGDRYQHMVGRRQRRATGRSFPSHYGDPPRAEEAPWDHAHGAS
jgi:hypothetical protein